MLAVMADESADISPTEQLSICVRFFFDSKIYEDFLGCVQVKETGSHTITNRPTTKLTQWGYILKTYEDRPMGAQQISWAMLVTFKNSFKKVSKSCPCALQSPLPKILFC